MAIGVVHHGISAAKPISGVIIYTVACPLGVSIQKAELPSRMNFIP
jgi:hypothetical protein